MVELFRPESGKWWRFSAYEIREGLIGPATDAILEEYDPWAEYDRRHDEYVQRHKEERKKDPQRLEQPYASLDRLAREVQFDSRGLPTAAAEALICSWCAKNGLLGIVPHRHPELPFQLSGGRRFAYCWKGGHWRPEPDVVPVLDSQFRKFFRGLPDPENSVPSPEDPDFWHAYCEPVHRFLDEANRLRDALHPLATVQEHLGEAREAFLKGLAALLPAIDERLLETEELPNEAWGPVIARMKKLFPGEDDRQMFRLSVGVFRGMAYVNSLVGGMAAVMLTGEDGKYHLKWRFPSLLSSLAMMVIHDLSGGSHLYECERCGNLFLNPRRNAEYCGTKCQNTAQKTRQRERVKEKRKTS